MTDEQINLAIGAIIHAELVMDFPDVILDALNSVIAFLATVNEQPERKKGKWIGKEQFANSPEFYSWQCSVCGCVLEDPTLDKPYTFCPNCGADMKEGEKSETD